MNADYGMAIETSTISSFAHEHAMDKNEWFLRRNCSLSPWQLGCAFGSLCAVMLVIALLFAVRGTWVVLAFAGLEIAAVAWAFFHYARRATDHEHIALADGCLLVERIEAGQTHQTRLNPHRTHIIFPKRYQDLIDLEANGVTVQVGRFATATRRREVAEELRKELQKQQSGFACFV
jgi:uncharacterized membrane protein